MFRIHIYIYRGRKEEGGGIKRDTTNRGRDHTQGLLYSVKEKREQRKSIRLILAWIVFSWQLEILSLSNP